MPQHEGFPTVAPEQAAQEAIFHQDGSLNEAFLSEHFGIGAEEAMQPVAFGSYTGTVAQMLGDERCPVGGMVRTAYQEKGIEGVAEKFKTLGDMDPKFSVKITEATVQREQVKKKVGTPETPDKGEIPKAEKPQKPTPEKTTESAPVRTKPTTVKIESFKEQQVHHETLLKADKPEIQKVAPDPAEIQAQIVKEVIVRQNITEPQVENVRQNETNNLVAWERQYAEELQADVVQTKQVGTVQQPVVPKPAEIVKAKTVDEPGVGEQLVQLTDSADKTPAPTDVIPALTLEYVPAETEGGVLEGRVIDDSEAPYFLEDFNLDNIALEQPEEPLSADDTYLETSIVEEDTNSIDVLLADLEEGMQLVESEYMGELLVGMFVDFVEIDDIDEQEDMLDVQPLQTTVIKSPESGSDSLEATVPQGEDFNIYLESLEPIQAESTKNVIEALSIAIRESQQLSEEITNEEKEITEQKLEELCIQLFDGLDIEYDEETVKQFMQSITAQESFVNLSIETDELSIEALNNMGTREYKTPDGTSLLGGLTQFIKQKMQPHLILGKYALQAVA